MNIEKSKAVKIIPLGGLEQIGMNITAIEYESSAPILMAVMAEAKSLSMTASTPT